jgi:hypothetical protein
MNAWTWGWALGLAGLLSAGTAAAKSTRAVGEEAAAASFTATSRVGFDDPENPDVSGKVSLSESALFAPLAHTEFGSLSLAAGAWASWTRLDFRNHPELHAENLYGLAAFLAAEQSVTPGWGWSAMAVPGFYSDFRSGRTGEGKILLHAVAEVAVLDAWRAQVGLAYDTAFGDPAVQVFRSESWRAGLGVERRLGDALWLRLAGGVEFDRRYEALSGGQTLLDDTVDDAGFLSVAVVLY